MADNISETLEQAVEAFNNGKVEVALNLWSQCVESVDPESHFAIHTNRGAAFERLGRYEEAIEAYDLALQSKPDHMEAIHNKAVALKALERYEEALACFETVASAQPDFLPSLRGLTDVYISLERYEDALNVARRAVERVESGEISEKVGPYSDLAFALLKSGDVSAAVDAYEALSSMEPLSGENIRLYGIALSQLAVQEDRAGNLSRAESLLEKALSIEPTESRLFNLAYLRMRTGRSDLAKEGFKAVTSQNPEHIQAWSALGTLHLQSKNYSEGLVALHKARELGLNTSEAFYNIGFASLKLKDNAAAVQYFQEALNVQPDMLAAQRGLAAAQKAISRASDTQGGSLSEESSTSPSESEVADISQPSQQAEAGVPADNNNQEGSGVEAGKSEPVVSMGGHANVESREQSQPSEELEVAPHSVSVSRHISAADADSWRQATRTTVQPAITVNYSYLRSAHSLYGSVSAGQNRNVSILTSPTGTGVLESLSAPDSPSKAFVSGALPLDGFHGQCFRLDELVAPGPFPEGIDNGHREAYLRADDFNSVFGTPKNAFYALPKWKRNALKKKVHLF